MANLKNGKRTERNAAFPLFMILFLLTGIILSGTAVFIYRGDIESFNSRLAASESSSISLQSRAVGNAFDVIVSDLLFFSRQNELLRFLSTDNTAYARAMEAEYLEMTKRKKIYDQIRFLDTEGMEKVRINYNGGKPEIVKRSGLQNKYRRYYFRDTMRLKKGEIFVSPLDLNIEKGKIEQPLKPMIRFGTPVFDIMGRKRGVVLINYLADNLLMNIKSYENLSPGSTMLVNKDGFWLLSPDKKDQWGFIMPGRKEKTMAVRYPREWNGILSIKNGQFRTRNGIFTFTTIYPLHEGFRTSTGSNMPYTPSIRQIPHSAYFWVLISRFPIENIKSHTHQIMVRFVLFTFSLLVITSIAAWFTALAVTRRKNYREELLRMAMYDSLTGLPNRRLFFDRLTAALEHSSRFGRNTGLLFIDLDGFKEINDTRGHDAGDELLKKVAEILLHLSRKSDTAARLGGDEFAVILFEIQSPESALKAGAKILKALSSQIELSGGPATISASIGVAVYPDSAENGDGLVKEADKAMYESKSLGKNRCTLSGFKGI